MERWRKNQTRVEENLVEEETRQIGIIRKKRKKKEKMRVRK